MAEAVAQKPVESIVCETCGRVLYHVAGHTIVDNAIVYQLITGHRAAYTKPHALGQSVGGVVEPFVFEEPHQPVWLYEALFRPDTVLV